MRLEEIKELMKAMDENGLSSFEYQEGNIHLSLRRGDGNICEEKTVVKESRAESVRTEATENTVVETHTMTAETVESSSEPDKVVVSPLVGVFYKASAPDAEPFVKVGDRVKKGQVLGIIEAMKLMNEIESEYEGVVEAVLIENEALVEYGQPLFRIR